MYQNLTSHVCVGAARSASYTVDAGVREGSCLSATLYALFIDPLLWQLEESGVGSRVSVGEAGASVYAGAICYADDLCLCADSELELQKLMDIVGAFTVERETFTAREKTSVLCFGADADTPLRTQAWTMRGLHKPPASDGGTRWDDASAFLPCSALGPHLPSRARLASTPLFAPSVRTFCSQGRNNRRSPPSPPRAGWRCRVVARRTAKATKAKAAREAAKAEAHRQVRRAT